MTSVPFVYAKRLLDECAASSLAMSLSRTEPDASSPEERSFRTSLIVETSSSENDRRMKYDKSCDKLWRSYIHHYGKTEDFAKSDEACFESDTWKDEKGQQMVVYSIGPRVERFLRSVVFVHKHNDDHPTSHRVSLNRFSAFETHHLFPDSVNFEASPRRRDTEVYSDIGIGHGAKNKLHHRHSNRHRVSRNVPVKRITVPDPFRKPFQTPVVGSNLDGFLLSIKRYHLQKDKARGGDRDARTDAVDSPNGYKRFLNWATPDNPDGVPIVHDAFDQQACGSCWAFAAAGSLEASASRRAAFIAYETYRTSHRNRLNLNHTVEEEAIAVGQRVQRRAMNVLNLSVQELLDCDSITDQGCVGGNPLLAFYYIHQNGLVSWEDYPYTATADTCLMNATQDPVATVKSWGIIKSDHEKHMQLALRYIGPIAVGINGDNAEFLAYSGGVFDSPRCKHKANHALLIVGYGEEIWADGEVVKYWIARNSWGTGWGENGYVRIKRGDGHSGVPGVCGISKNPSVALGGVLLRHTAYVFNESGLLSKGFRMENLCTHLGFNASSTNPCEVVAGFVDTHRALTLGLIGVLCGLILIWPLSMDVRRRRRYRRIQKIRREERRRNSSRQTTATEDTPLISDSNRTPATRV